MPLTRPHASHLALSGHPSSQVANISVFCRLHWSAIGITSCNRLLAILLSNSEVWRGARPLPWTQTRSDHSFGPLNRYRERLSVCEVLALLSILGFTLTPTYCVVASAWVAGIVVDAAYQAEDRGAIPSPDTPGNRSNAILNAAQQNSWQREGDDKLTLWNGLRQPAGREESDTDTAASTSATGTITMATAASTTVSPTSATAESSTTPDPSGPSWASGWCGTHVEQEVYGYKSDTTSVKIYDATKYLIRWIDPVDDSPTFEVGSRLPYFLEIIADGVSGDYLVHFAYGDQVWKSNDLVNGVEDNERCSAGKWDGAGVGMPSMKAKRQIDCGFSC